MTATRKSMMLCQHQNEIDVCFDNNGDMIISQDRWPEEDPHQIIISRDAIDTFIDRLTDAIGIPSFGGPQPWADENPAAGVDVHLVDDGDLHTGSKPKDATAAERQRRHREKKQLERDGHAETTVTDSDTVTTAPSLPELDFNGGGNTALAN